MLAIQKTFSSSLCNTVLYLQAVGAYGALSVSVYEQVVIGMQLHVSRQEYSRPALSMDSSY